MEKDEYFKSINMICAAQRNTKEYLVGMILEMMEKWEWKIREKMDEMSVWLEGEWGRKMVGPAIFSPAPPN